MRLSALSLLLLAANVAAQVVEVRAPSALPSAPVPALTLPSAPALTLGAPSLFAPAVPLGPTGGAPVLSALAPVPARPAATMPLVDFAAKPEAIRAFLASHPKGKDVNPALFQRLVERVFLTAPLHDGWLSLAALREAAERDGDEKALTTASLLSDLPRVTAEGVVRRSIFAPTRRELDAAQKTWDRDSKGRPIADAVIVGAGPAGLSAALHASHAGLKTVLFEGGYAGQSFSDAGMKAVYRMRTPAPRNSLAQAPFSPPELVDSVGMTANLSAYRSAGQAADAALYAKTGLAPVGGARAGLETPDPAIASARNELLQHFSDVAVEIVRRGGVVAELSPVESAVKEKDGLWTVIVNGRVQRARKLVLAQGQVGTQLQHARLPLDLQTALRDAGEKPLVLRDRRELAGLNKQLAAWIKARRAGKRSRRLIVNDTLLGSAEVEGAFRLLPKGARTMIVGSGESAVKAAVAALRLNPGLSVDLFVKEPLQPAQLQIPPAHAAPDAIAAALKDPALAAKTLGEWEAFGTPVTPATLADLELFKKAGRLRVIALGKKCIAAACDMRRPDPAHTIELAKGKDGALRVYASDPGVIEELKKAGVGSREAKTGRWLVSVIDGPVISAVGYDRASLRRDTVTKMLADAGRLVPTGGKTKTTAHEFAMSPSNPLVSAGDPDLYFAGAQNTAMSADSAIPGGVARAAAVAADIAKSVARAPKAAARRGGALGRKLLRGFLSLFGA